MTTHFCPQCGAPLPAPGASHFCVASIPYNPRVGPGGQMTVYPTGTPTVIPIGSGGFVVQRREVPQELAAEPIIAWRAWGTDSTGLLRPTAVGMAFRDTWATRDATARCLRCLYLFGTPPGVNCGCGLYACKTEDGIRGNPHRIWGQVALYGKVIEHEHGYRAQHARILDLHTREEDLAESLRQRYGVPVTRHPRPAHSIGEKDETFTPYFQRVIVAGALRASGATPFVSGPPKRRGWAGYLILSLANTLLAAVYVALIATGTVPAWSTPLILPNAFAAGWVTSLYLRPRP